MATRALARVTGPLVRLLNFVLLLWGLAMLGYGGFLASKYTSSYAVYGSLLGLGLVTALFAGIIVTCGYRSLFVLRLYGLVIGLLEIAQVAIAVLFMVPDGRNKILDAASLPADLRQSLENNLAIAGPMLLAVVGFQLLTLAVVGCQCLAVEQTDPEDEEETQVRASLLGGSGRATAPSVGKSPSKAAPSKAGSSPTTKAGVPKATRFVKDDTAGAAASTRYKDKTSGYREKYGLDK